ncbi:M48 family metalloprotease [Natrinema sp. 1APR25-10V2]|uniref:M48 family metallopeptidase n=1 Tax=Natrinema sp. 1APR25-10V2 TaxID=2951081 RepID=UPI0028765B8E|nr:M48 family metalloprotease [Natrinema sp. 1APR25-10V2]MDS0473641.1 M48 family metalloprotease [Natrinema sp. 1APR25-10V2]
MRVRTTLSLAVRAIGAAAIGLGTLAALGLVLAILGGLAIGGLVVAAVGAAVDPGPWVLVGAFLLGTALTLLTWAAVVRRAVRRSRRRLLRETEPIDPEESGRVESSASRLAAQFDLPLPELRRHPAATPIACTTSSSGEPVVVVSAGLLEALPDPELEAVLAHELAHVANDDLRLMTWVLVPLVASEEFFEMMDDDDDFDPGVLPWLAAGWLLTVSSTLGVGLFSRGREFAADRAAVAATGDPGALAAALERLDSSTAVPPPDDLRKHAGSVDAMSVLPTLDPERDGGGGLLATHPATERRLERLRRLAAE